ncbi:N-acyl-D-amino-acid deacylase family protein [Sphingobium tyrosinilyticum]|uniref:Amidohydrolase family protein n=1 Tax=Sphingobium tyrosinilyticum TaxID=2715436 RepID=A0ABV9F5E4_9SPHN
MHDIVIRGGMIVDGSGAPAFVGDVAIDGERISRVGLVPERGREDIDATGKIVSPGFIDLHTHYDAQVMWDPILAPTSWNGVTTIVMGNCGVGFAPARPDSRNFLMEVMEAVEEIPQPVLRDGLAWDWESFPEYLDAIERRQHTIDIGTQVGNVALRRYVLGDRSGSPEPASSQEIETMNSLLEEALRAGALGFSFSRTDVHRMTDGSVIPGADVPTADAFGMSGSLAAVGGRVIQFLGNAHAHLDEDMEDIVELARRSRSAIHFPMTDMRWRERIDMIERAAAEGLDLYGQVPPRGQGAVAHWDSASRPFENCPSFQAIAHLPLAERLTKLRDPEVRSRIIAEFDPATDSLARRTPLSRIFPAGDYPNYEPDPEIDSIAAIASATGSSPAALMYDEMMRDDGTGMLIATIFNYAAGDFSDIREILLQRGTIPSMSDAGAHSTRVVDAAQPTFMLQHWVRDRTRGEKLPLETVIKGYTRDAAVSYGMLDRGLVAEGYLADLNIIDLTSVRLPKPYRAYDLPAGGLRLLQKPEGYIATIKRGVVTFRNGEHCGRFPGQLVRGAQPALIATAAA